MNSPFRILPLLLTLAILTSCVDEQSPEFLLSTQLNALSHSLNDAKTCDDKTNYLQKWVHDRESLLNSQRDAFKTGCSLDKPYFMQCMAVHMFASAKVEKALEHCPPSDDLLQTVSQINKIAYAGIRISDTEK